MIERAVKCLLIKCSEVFHDQVHVGVCSICVNLFAYKLWHHEFFTISQLYEVVNCADNPLD